MAVLLRHLSQVTVDYGISSYFHTPSGVYVNLFVPSRVLWTRGSNRITLEQSTQYPFTPNVTVRVHCERPETFAVHLRVPAWAGAGTRVTVNGVSASGDLTPGSWAAIRREWKVDDRIEYRIDMPLRLEAVDPQHPAHRRSWPVRWHCLRPVPSTAASRARN